jgi:hypothetical protein
MRRLVLFSVFVFCVLMLVAMANAQIIKRKGIVADSRYVKYEGVLSDPSGGELDGEYMITFRIYDSLSSTTPLWEESHRVTVESGGFQVILGKRASIPSSEEESYYIGLFIEGEGLFPRNRLHTEWDPGVEADLSVTNPEKDAYFPVDQMDTRYVNVAGDTMVGDLYVDAQVGVGTRIPLEKLDVAGTIRATGIKLPTGATTGYILTSDSSGVGSWQPAPAGGGGGWSDDGTVVRLDAGSDSVGIGTSSPSAKLDVVGDALISGKMTIGPGQTNTGVNSFVAGENNTVSDSSSTVSGGKGNTASGRGAAIGGGGGNLADSLYTAVGGGWGNSASAPAATIAGGAVNSVMAGGNYATIGGGQINVVDKFGATIGGGQNNTAGQYGTVAGGISNAASGDQSVAAGGQSNTASGRFSTVPGGGENSASGDYSYAAGRRAKASHGGTFVWADTTNADFSSTAANQFLIRAAGGVGIGTTNPASAKLVVDGGAQIAIDATSSGSHGMSASSTGSDGIYATSSAGGGFAAGNFYTSTPNTYGLRAESSQYEGLYASSGGSSSAALRAVNNAGGPAAAFQGYVGIGTTIPELPLHIYGDQLATIQLEHSGTYGWAIGTGHVEQDLVFSRTDMNGFWSVMRIQDEGLISISPGADMYLGPGLPDSNAVFSVDTDKRYSGYFASDRLNMDTEVIRSEYTGTGPYDATAVYGISTPQDYYGYGGKFQGGYIGVDAGVNPTGSDIYLGVSGYATGGSGMNYGVYGVATGTGTNHGVYGLASGGSSNFAGYFSGDVHVNGTLSKGGGSFKIDHPLDPENKYLYHSFVESPDMKNIYDGVVVLDGRGEALVQFPDWFDPLNRDFRYQLTAIGAPGPNLYIAEKISSNRFKIAGGEPRMEVSWQVTGIRQDRFAEANRIPVEEDKLPEDRGKYLHPDAHNRPETMGIGYHDPDEKR